MQYYSYENFKDDARLLIEELKKLHFDAIVGVCRGGLTLSHVLAQGLEIRNVQTLRTALYDKTQKREKITIEGTCSFTNVKKVLVVDDIADSGETFSCVIESLKNSHREIEFVTAALFYKKTSIYEPHFWVREAKEWIDFFWEKDFQ